MARSALKAATERALSRNACVVLDSVNGIKGYRYLSVLSGDHLLAGEGGWTPGLHACTCGKPLDARQSELGT